MRDETVRVLLHAAAWSPLVVVLVRLLAAHWLPLGDDAHLSLHAYSVASWHPPLVGPVSMVSEQAHPIFDPGPLVGYLLSPALVLDPSTGILWGSVAVAGLVLSALIEVLLVVQGRVAAAAAAGTWALVLIAQPSLGLHLVWNPSLGMVFFLATLGLSVVVAKGHPRLLPALVVVSSLATCSHTVLLLPSVAVLVVATGWCLATASKSVRPWLAAAVGVGMLCWLPPIAQEVFGRHPNLSALWDVVHHGPSLGLGLGLSAIGHATPEFILAPPHLVSGAGGVAYLAARPAAAGVAVVAVVVAILVWGVRRQHRSIAVVASITLALASAEAVAFGTIKERVAFGLTWTVIFLWPVALLVTGLVAAVVAHEVARWRGGHLQLRATVAVATTVLLGLVASVDLATTQRDPALERQAIAVATARQWIDTHVRRGPLQLVVVVDGQVGLDSASQLFGLEYLLRTDGFSPPNDQILENGTAVHRGPVVWVEETHDVVRRVFVVSSKGAPTAASGATG